MRKKNFKERVLSVVSSIPRGKVLSYKQVALYAGSSGASRAVGTIMAANYDSQIPCHRVIQSDGSVGGYNRGVFKKIEKLNEEGVVLPAI